MLVVVVIVVEAAVEVVVTAAVVKVLGWLIGKSAGLVIGRLRVRIPAGAAGEC